MKKKRRDPLKHFLDLWNGLDGTTKTTEKVAIITEFFRVATPQDSIWAIALLTGKRPPNPVKRNLIRQWACEEAGLEDWLFEESYGAVGDFSETISLLIPHSGGTSERGLADWMDWASNLALQTDEVKRARLVDAWQTLDQQGRFILHKLIGGAFRVGASRELVVRGLSKATGIPSAVLAHRLMGNWEPTNEFYLQLTEPADKQVRLSSQPYPFCLAHPLESELETLGQVQDWLIEYKWDGIRAQLIRREGKTYLWSRGEDMIEQSFPEIIAIGDNLPDGTVLDGEILAWAGDNPAPFSELQRRLGRKTVGKKLLAEVPCQFVAFDCLEFDSQDLRPKPLSERRERLERLAIKSSPRVTGENWDDISKAREAARDFQSEGLMLKRLDSTYEGGRKKGIWWKWKLAPFTVDAVLIYAQRGAGKRANLYTDYTFGIWSEGNLVPFAKAYSGLTDAEIAQVDRFIRNNIKEKFGPVRTVNPELVFEIAFEGIQLSTRHKSGIAVRFPRILRWRQDKTPADADTLERVKALLEARN